MDGRHTKVFYCSFTSIILQVFPSRDRDTPLALYSQYGGMAQMKRIASG